MKLVEGRVAIDDVDAFVDQLAGIGIEHGAIVQAFDARYVAGKAHLEAAVRSARRALEHDDAIADDPAVELLLYAAGRRQIDRALGIGVSSPGGPVVVVVEGGDEAAAVGAVDDLLEPASALGEARDEDAIQRFYGIEDRELAATEASLEALVIERVALLAVEK